MVRTVRLRCKGMQALHQHPLYPPTATSQHYSCLFPSLSSTRPRASRKRLCVVVLQGPAQYLTHRNMRQAKTVSYLGWVPKLTSSSGALSAVSLVFQLGNPKIREAKPQEEISNTFHYYQHWPETPVVNPIPVRS